MTLRTPRRRISPRTKRRYRAIKDFLRRALGSSSQPDIKINSSIAINVTDLKHKINGLEHQLNEVNKHCQDLVCLETSSRKDCPILVDTEDGTELASLKEQSEISTTQKCSAVETKLLFKTPESEYRKSDDSNCIGKIYDDTNSKNILKSTEMAKEDYAYKERKLKKRKSKLDSRLQSKNGSQPNLHKHKTRSVYENFASNVSTSSYHSLIDPRATHTCSTAFPVVHHEREHKHHNYIEPLSTNTTKVKTRKDHIRKTSPENQIYETKRKNKMRSSRDLDQDFITDIIKRQYRPMKMFGKRDSGMSQISAPICRDQEFTIREDILEGSDLCSCCIDGRKKDSRRYENRLKDKRSICDTRLYSAKRQLKQRQHRKEDFYQRYHEIYNDSEQYDLIPVKEKSSPKSRRKVLLESTIPHNCYKEVPPSPRTQRPRLNLKAQYYTEFEDFMMQRKELKPRKNSPHRFKIHQAYFDNESSDMIDYYKEKRKAQLSKKTRNGKHVQHDSGTMSCSPSPLYHNETNNVIHDNLFNKTQDSDMSGDKTDKALTEIKDILQSFLQEIKKETNSVSQCGNSDIMTSKPGDKCLNEFRPSSTKLNTSVIPESGLCMNNFGIPQCNIPPPPFVPPFTNPCCYPILPICPMNCMQSGFILPSTSCTCNCANNSKDSQPSKNVSNESNTAQTSTDTEELIKEIYKVVAQNPNNDLRKNYKEKQGVDSPKRMTEEKVLTSRSAGGSSRISKHDVEVCTQKIKCHSKSCEAIGSRMTSDTYYSRTNPTYSDTVLERLSLEATASNTGSESGSEQAQAKKVPKQNKFAKVLRSFGLLKKKKDVIEELSESESTVEVSIKPKQQPFRQEITNYSMHSQEYYNRPPIPVHHDHRTDPYHSNTMDHRHGYRTPHVCPFGCPEHLSPTHSSMYDSYDNYNNKVSQPHRIPSPRRSPQPSAPPYPNPYDHHFHHGQPQVPLCLKEIEVKSTGTQSERKMPFFRRLTRKMQDPMTMQRIDDSGARNCSTQTAVEKPQPTKLLPASKLAKINWKTLQAKVNELDKPDNFTYKTQKKLAEGDIKMRNVMLKKLFYKRNPFSPRNIIVKTILGRDKSSYGDAPMMYRPRLLL